MLSYASYKFIDLLELNDYKLQEAVQENFFLPNVTLSQNDGFQVAAAITSYDGSSEIIEDPSIGTIKMYIKGWGVQDETEGSLFFNEIKTKLCTSKELNDVAGSNTNSKFFKTDPESEGDLGTYGPKMRCIDDDNLDVFGNYDTNTA